MGLNNLRKTSAKRGYVKKLLTYSMVFIMDITTKVLKFNSI